MGETEAAAMDFTPYIVVFNSFVTSAVLIGVGKYLASRKLTTGVPQGRQLFGEFVLNFFVNKAREMSHGHDRSKVVGIVTPVLATFFLFILVANMFATLPFPMFNRPPTSFYGVTLGLAIASVLATLSVSAQLKGTVGTVKHLFWPNPLEWVSKFTDVLSLSLRLFGNIAGEFMTISLVAIAVPIGIPLILHVLGLIPTFVQAFVFTLLTASFMAQSIHKEEKKPKPAKAGKKRFALFGKKKAALEAATAAEASS
jgi:F-type H+-transporting ATPase subunit a